MPRDADIAVQTRGIWHLEQGDCREVMRRWAGEGIQVDAVITDPPFHLMSVVKRFGKLGSAPAQHGRDGAAARISAGMMGATWDGAAEGELPIAFDPATWAAALALLKPGGRIAAFGGCRTWHRMACAIEDAGAEIEDTIAWVFGQGLVLRRSRLNPGWSPIVVARKAGPVQDLGIEACRIDNTEGARLFREGDYKATANATYAGRMDGSLMGGSKAVGTTDVGRWPKNLTHDNSPDVRACFPAAPGQLAAARRDGTDKGNRVYGAMRHESEADPAPRNDGADTSAARFFNACEWSDEDRELILRYESKIKPGDKVFRCSICDVPIGKAEMPAHQHEMPDWRHVIAHPTQKPYSLMAWLCRLISPVGGIVLDPFAGTGVTLKAAIDEGFDAMGIEQSANYCAETRFRLTQGIGSKKRG